MITFECRRIQQFGEVKIHIGNMSNDFGFLSNSELKELLEEVNQFKENLEWLIQVTDDC